MLTELTKLLNPINILDIAIVAIFIYKVIALLKGTRAVQLVKGLLLLLIFSVLSEWLGLTTVNWLLVQARTVLLIAIPIVFQPELRRGLEQLGNSTFWNPSGKSRMKEAEATRVVDQLVPFLLDASRSQTGVLLALQRDVGLGEYVNTGIKINGMLSYQLLGNIFIVNTPLHDGAVIIADDQILAASCYLPLSENKNINKALGTRHRAGIGLSEVSDAVVCIVSEETGSISIAQNGQLQSRLTESELRRILMTELQNPEAKSIIQKWRGGYGKKNK